MPEWPDLTGALKRTPAVVEGVRFHEVSRRQSYAHGQIVVMFWVVGGISDLSLPEHHPAVRELILHWMEDSAEYYSDFRLLGKTYCTREELLAELGLDQQEIPLFSVEVEA